MKNLYPEIWYCVNEAGGICFLQHDSLEECEEDCRRNRIQKPGNRSKWRPVRYVAAENKGKR